MVAPGPAGVFVVGLLMVPGFGLVLLALAVVLVARRAAAKRCQKIRREAPQGREGGSDDSGGKTKNGRQRAVVMGKLRGQEGPNDTEFKTWNEDSMEWCPSSGSVLGVECMKEARNEG